MSILLSLSIQFKAWETYVYIAKASEIDKTKGIALSVSVMTLKLYCC